MASQVPALDNTPKNSTCLEEVLLHRFSRQLKVLLQLEFLSLLLRVQKHFQSIMSEILRQQNQTTMEIAASAKSGRLKV